VHLEKQLILKGKKGGRDITFAAYKLTQNRLFVFSDNKITSTLHSTQTICIST